MIVAVDGREVRTAEDLGSILDSICVPDTTVPVEIVDPSGEQRTIQVTLAERRSRSTSRKATAGRRALACTGERHAVPAG